MTQIDTIRRRIVWFRQRGYSTERIAALVERSRAYVDAILSIEDF